LAPKIIGTYADGGVAEADMAIAAARRVFETTQWSGRAVALKAPWSVIPGGPVKKTDSRQRS
jgi:hypothetical protein